jgi:hypothetical protein
LVWCRVAGIDARSFVPRAGVFLASARADVPAWLRRLRVKAEREPRPVSPDAWLSEADRFLRTFDATPVATPPISAAVFAWSCAPAAALASRPAAGAASFAGAEPSTSGIASASSGAAPSPRGGASLAASRATSTSGRPGASPSVGGAEEAPSYGEAGIASTSVFACDGASEATSTFALSFTVWISL